mmetsp:Transcript_4420/g.5113  ORF Transcript_4420/g.5113 Transcript_4420/m.5113 type:complete len:480 (-) Transcript_4420:151-1590(-)
MTKIFSLSGFLKILFFFLTLASCNSSEKKTGFEYFTEAKRLVKENQLDEAATNFWGSVISYKPEFPYTVEEAHDYFLSCYAQQNKLALGYAFIAAQMHSLNDGRYREYMKKAYNEDPTDEKILQLLEYMGETETTILSEPKKEKEQSPQPPKIQRSKSPKLPKTSTDHKKEKPHACRSRKACEKYIKKPDLRSLEVGWEDVKERNYVHTKSRLHSTPNRNVTIAPVEKFEVSYDKLWGFFDDGQIGWKPETFKILQKYLTKETIYIDVGAYIGSTIFFASQLAKRSFGLDPDPVSFATIEHNLVFNPGKNIHVHGIAVVAPSDAGYVQFETEKMGDGESMIVPEITGTKKEDFQAAGFTLPFLATLWGVQLKENPVFIRISIEPYECKLIPSFYEWLVDEKIQNLTILVTLNSQIKPCTTTEMEGILKTFQLFHHVSCNDHNKPLPINTETSFTEFEKILETEQCFTKTGENDFLLIGA